MISLADFQAFPVPMGKWIIFLTLEVEVEKIFTSCYAGRWTLSEAAHEKRRNLVCS